MKSNNILRSIKACIGIFLVPFFISCTPPDPNALLFNSVDEMRCADKVVVPISTEKMALCFAMNFDDVVELLTKAHKQMGFDGWIVRVKKSDGINSWEVEIRSYGSIIPVYSCKLVFSENGKLLVAGHNCGYEK